MTGTFIQGWPAILLAAWLGICAAGVIGTWVLGRKPLTPRDHAETGVYDQHAHQRARSNLIRGPWPPRAVQDERRVQASQRPRTGLVEASPQGPPVRFGSAGAVDPEDGAA